jgi:hypothetical protein
MQRNELVKRIEALDFGDCLSMPLSEITDMFSSNGSLDDGIERATAFAEQNSCRFLYYRLEHREPEFFKTTF